MAQAKPSDPSDPVSYSVIVPAYNEEALLPRTLASVRAAMARTDGIGELIVVDNNSTDATPRIARELGARVVFEPKNQISRARNAGAAASRGRALFFLDADSILPADLPAKALAHLAGGRCSGGGAVFALDDPSHRIASRMVNAFNAVAVRHQFAAGCFIYSRRDAFEAIGGFDERVYAGTDVRFSKALKRWGKQHGLEFRVIADSPVLTSSRKLEHPTHYVASMVFHALFPFAIYFRSLCWYWYTRR